jgi:hypothetical protein
MEISEVDKIMPRDISSTARPDHFWKLIAPRLLESSSLAVIQEMIREDRPLSAGELAARLELEVERVRRGDLSAGEPSARFGARASDFFAFSSAARRRTSVSRSFQVTSLHPSPRRVRGEDTVLSIGLPVDAGTVRTGS